MVVLVKNLDVDSQNLLRGRARNRSDRFVAGPCSKPFADTSLRRVTYEKRFRLESCARDPIGYVDGLTLYRAYFARDGVDPSGLSVEPPCLRCPIAFAPPTIPPGPNDSPGPDWEWRPKGVPVGDPEGAWYNPGTGESLHPDLGHPYPKGPHWGWTDPCGNGWDYFPGTGHWEPHPKRNNPRKPRPQFPPGTEPTTPITLLPVIDPPILVEPIDPPSGAPQPLPKPDRDLRPTVPPPVYWPRSPFPKNPPPRFWPKFPRTGPIGFPFIITHPIILIDPIGAGEA
jgi:hypothetical protein